MTTHKKLIVATGALLLTLALAVSFTRPSYADSASDSVLAQWQAIYWYWALGDPDDAGRRARTRRAAGADAVGVAERHEPRIARPPWPSHTPGQLVRERCP